MSLQVQPYLCFEGRCEEALEFYRSALGAKVEMMMRVKDSPEPMSGEGCPAGTAGAGPSADMVMHAAFTIGQTQILASDGMGSGNAKFEGISLSLSPANAAEAARLFNALADGGIARMSLDKTFFSPAFGMVVDRFGVSWLIVVPQ